MGNGYSAGREISRRLVRGRWLSRARSVGLGAGLSEIRRDATESGDAANRDQRRTESPICRGAREFCAERVEVWARHSCLACGDGTNSRWPDRNVWPTRFGEAHAIFSAERVEVCGPDILVWPAEMEKFKKWPDRNVWPT